MYLAGGKESTGGMTMWSLSLVGAVVGLDVGLLRRKER